MIIFDQVSFRYDAQSRAIFNNVCAQIPEGDLCLVAGGTGSGKSTLLGMVNGLVPHFSGGLVSGRVLVADRDTREAMPRDMADVVGYVGQDPLAGFVTDTVEAELAYGMEQIGVHPRTMRTRVEEWLDVLGIAALRSRSLRTLSGGQQQRVSIAAALAAGSRVLVLDEPTSSLDPTSAEEVLAAVLRLVHDLAVTVLIAEHRLERVIGYADSVLYLPGDGSAVLGDPAQVMRTCPLAPPVVELARVTGLAQMPMTVRAARRGLPQLRDRLAGISPTDIRMPRSGAETALSASDITVTYGDHVAVRGQSMSLTAGQVAVMMGRNGSGKSSLLWALTGLHRSAQGTVNGQPLDPKAANLRQDIALVPQTPSDLLFRRSVEQECQAADQAAGAASGTCAELLEDLAPGIDGSQYPRDLSEGQRMCLALAVQLPRSCSVLLLDEPTRGLDYAAKEHLAGICARLAADGQAICLATHDVEFAAKIADRVIVLAEGEIIADGPTGDVLPPSASLAPQVARVLHPLGWLTADDVATALGQQR